MKTAHVNWVKDLQFIANGGSNQGLILDSVPDQGGDGIGSSPMELVLEGLAGCTGMDVISILKKKRQQVSTFRIEASGERATEHPKMFTSIHLIYYVSGTGVSEKAVRDAVNLSSDKYCSVASMLNKTVKITHDVKVEEI